MQQILQRIASILVGFSICLASCVSSQVKTLSEVDNSSQTANSGVKIFLLERDIPQDIEQLGVVSLSINTRPGPNIDEHVKQQLQKDCQRLGANGAYRISEGTYYPIVVSYLVFRYKK